MKILMATCLAVTTLLVVGVMSDFNAKTNSPLNRDINNSLQLTHSWHAALSINQTPGQSIRLKIPIENRTYTLELDSHSTRADEYTVFMQDNNGELYEVPAGAVRTLRGSIAELDGSVVAGGLMPDGLYARIRLADGKEYWMEPLVDKINGAAHNLYVFYRTEDIIPSDGVCATGEFMHPGKSFGTQTGRETNRGSFLGDNLCTAQLAFDADYEYFQAWGLSTASRINLVVNTINLQYESDVNLTHEITTIIVRSNSNDPYSSSNYETLLYQFQAEWTSNQSSITRDVAHLFTGREMDGNVIGVAWVGAVCNFTYQYGLSQSDFNGNFSCATDLTAHELGHNWNAGHCDCPSYTMNPYITCANQFTQGSINTITSFANTLSCLSCEPGGCCIEVNCSIMTASDCADLGGTYLGDNTNCNGDPCNDPESGACCLIENCSILTASACSDLGGTYLGDNTNCNGDPCNDPESGVGLDFRLTATDAVGSDTWTVDIYVVLNEGERLDAVAGDGTNNKRLATSGSFYQHEFGGPMSTSINPAAIPSFPLLAYDSWVTIGLRDLVGNALIDIGIDWASFEAGSDLFTDNGVWFVTPDYIQGEAILFTNQNCEDKYGVLVAQVTVNGLSESIFMGALFQGRDVNSVTWNDTAEITIWYPQITDCNSNSTDDSCDITNGYSNDDNSNGIPDECECLSDINSDEIVDVDDLLVVIADWNTCKNNCVGDVNDDGTVDIIDLLIVIDNWGPCE